MRSGEAEKEMKTKHMTKQPDTFHRLRGRRRTIASSSPTCLQEIAHHDGKTEKNGTIPSIRERIPGWTDEEMLGLALLLAEDEEEHENYKLHLKARSRLQNILEI